MRSGYRGMNGRSSDYSVNGGKERGGRRQAAVRLLFVPFASFVVKIPGFPLPRE